MQDVTEDDLTRWERLCDETYRNGAEREYQSLGAEALRALPRLIAAHRQSMAEIERLRATTGDSP